MKVEDAIKLLKETNENKFLEIVIPSTTEKVNFKELSTKLYQELTKVGFLDLEKFPDKLNETISELSSIDATELTEYDRRCVYMLLKANNKVDGSLKYSIPCTNELCGELLNKQIELGNIYKERLFGDSSYELKDGDVDIKIDLNEPTVKEVAAFRVYVDSQLASLKNQEDKDLYDSYVNRYESKILYIDTISINGTPVEDYKSMGIRERIKFLSNFSHSIVDVPKIDEYSKDSFNNLITEDKCESCGLKNINVIHYSDFLLI